MNRAERRRLNRENEKDAVINIKQSELEKIKMDASSQALDIAFKLMLSIPVMVIHDKFGQLMRKDVDGKCREERFSDLCLEIYDCFDKGYITLDDLMKTLEDETGVKLIKL